MINQIPYQLGIGTSVKIFFDTEEEQKQYIAEESAYCINEIRILFRAITKKERDEAKLALTDKRLEFAKSKKKFLTNIAKVKEENS